MEYVGEGGLQDIKDRVYKRTGQVTLDASGDAVIDFGSAVILPREPYVSLAAQIASGDEPVVVNVRSGSFTVNADGEYTGVTIEGARLRALPNPLALLSALLGFRVWTKSDASGVKVDWMVF